MAESTNHLDVEDVLSSIRRLVADGPVKSKPKSAGPPLFVLTPAHRVSGDAIGAATGEMDQARPPVFDLASEPEALPQDVVVSEKAEPLMLSQPQWEPANPEPHDATKPMLLTERVTVEDEDMVQHDEPAPDPVDSLAGNDDARHVLETRIAELERAVGRVEEEWEPDGSEPQEQHQPKLQFLKRYRDRFEVIDGDGADLDAPQGKALQTPTQQDNGLHDPLANQPATFAHRPHPGDMAPADMPETAKGNASNGDVIDGQDDFFVDEAVLRSMVSDIVREELQGRLGERITRNVRRMVRHEIEKALSLKALE